MQIKNIYFVHPCIVECVNDDNLRERKLVFFDFKRNAIVNPSVDGKKLEFLTSYDDLMLVSQQINKIIADQKQDNNDNQDIIFEKQTNLNNIIKNIDESASNEFREIKS